MICGFCEAAGGRRQERSDGVPGAAVSAGVVGRSTVREYFNVASWLNGEIARGIRVLDWLVDGRLRGNN